MRGTFENGRRRCYDKLTIPTGRRVATARSAPVATVLTGKAGGGKVVWIIPGGNIETVKLVKILRG